MTSLAPPLRLQGQHGTTGTTETTGTAQTGREMVGRLACNSIPVDSALRRLGARGRDATSRRVYEWGRGREGARMEP